jgi:hypothetical protein
LEGGQEADESAVVVGLVGALSSRKDSRSKFLARANRPNSRLGLRGFKHRIEKFAVGGIYLIAGQPGIGKSTLGLQIALDLGRRNEKTFYILTEQSKEDLRQRARRMTSDWRTEDSRRALGNVQPEDNVYDIETLPNFFAHQIMSPSSKYHGVKVNAC